MKIINIQAIEKRDYNDGKTLSVHSVFYTIQGEGPYAGRPAVFVRLAGCNLQCPGCDTEYTNGRYTATVTKLLAQINGSFAGQTADPAPLVVITGGEPLRQNLSLLLEQLTEADFEIQIETNGTLALPFMQPEVFENVTVVCSPKAGKVHPTVYKHADCFKYVLSHNSIDKFDGLPVLALDHSASPRVARPRPEAPVYLQPMDTQDEAENKKNVAAVLASCLRYGYILQLQIHKLIGTP